MPVADGLILSLAYGALFAQTAFWAAHQLLFPNREKVILAARGSGALAAVLLAAGLALRGLKVGYWPFHTAYEWLVAGLVGLALAPLVLLSPRHHRPASLALSCLSSLAAVYALLVGNGAVPAIHAPVSGWQVAYVTSCGFGGGAAVVAGVASVAFRHAGQGQRIEERALAWSLLTLSVGLASGAWWFQRLSGRYWGDARWAGMVVVWLLTWAAWHGRGERVGRGWRSALVGVTLALAGGYVVLGLGAAT
ncbi:MAG: hypothetical protein JSV36_06170 [Anaerolineae bacterium]|nr:MAG: hypothetical protein JSV36_06170 [Anaerolineae bacterium]